MTATADSHDNPPLQDWIGGAGARAFLGTLRVATQVTRQVDVELRQAGTGIKASEWDLLALLAIFGPLRPSELTMRSSLSGNATTVSTILNRLESKGYATRKPHESEPGGVVVHLTPAGSELFDDMFPRLLNKLVRPFELHFTSDELETLDEFWSRF